MEDFGGDRQIRQYLPRKSRTRLDLQSQLQPSVSGHLAKPGSFPNSLEVDKTEIVSDVDASETAERTLCFGGRNTCTNLT